jgi:hypothetical protein
MCNHLLITKSNLIASRSSTRKFYNEWVKRDDEERDGEEGEMTKEVIMRGREAIMKDKTKTFGDKIFYDLQWN